jgi:ABC-2 type transport system ATP-binding protein
VLDPAVFAQDLVVRYGTVTAVDGVSLRAGPGEVTVVLGANGAGKTTTIETLEGFRRPGTGRVGVLGLDPVSDHRALAGRIGVMLQGGGVQPGIRVAEALAVEAAFYDRPLEIPALLDRLGLGTLARRTWRQISGGEQQRVLLALALVGQPEVVFLDEPTSGVDIGGRRTIREIVHDLAAGGVTVVLSTHELAEAEHMAHRVVLLDRGRVVAQGSLDELCASDAGIRFQARPGIDVAPLAGRVLAPAREVEPGRYEVDGPATPERVAAVTAWLAERSEALGGLDAGRRSLEETVIDLVGRRIDVEATPYGSEGPP